MTSHLFKDFWRCQKESNLPLLCYFSIKLYHLINCYLLIKSVLIHKIKQLKQLYYIFSALSMFLLMVTRGFEPLSHSVYQLNYDITLLQKLLVMSGGFEPPSPSILPLNYITKIDCYTHHSNNNQKFLDTQSQVTKIIILYFFCFVNAFLLFFFGVDGGIRTHVIWFCRPTR